MLSWYSRRFQPKSPTSASRGVHPSQRPTCPGGTTTDNASSDKLDESVHDSCLVCVCFWGRGRTRELFVCQNIWRGFNTALINISELWGGLARFFHVGMVPAACGNVETLHSTG